jgi:hypothetical protein
MVSHDYGCLRLLATCARNNFMRARHSADEFATRGNGNSLPVRILGPPCDPHSPDRKPLTVLRLRDPGTSIENNPSSSAVL